MISYVPYNCKLRLYFWPQVAEIITKGVFFEAVLIVRLVLILLSSRLGTFLLCGFLCLGNKWPYFNTFSSIPLEKREQVVQNWYKNWFFTPIRLGFIFIKFLCLLTFFSQVKPPLMILIVCAQ